MRGNIDGNHEIRAHRSGYPHRHRTGESAIDIFAAIDRHRLEYAGYAARCPHRHAGVASAEHDHRAAVQVSGDGGKLAAEFFQRTIVDGAIDEALQRLALEHAAIRQRPVADFVFLHLQGDLLQLETIVASGIQGADYGACAGANDDVGLNALRLKRLDHTDVSEAPRRAAAQYQSNLRRWAQ